MTLPSHLFVSSCDGNLYDTRDTAWYQKPPLRTTYKCSRRIIYTVADLKATLRAGAYTDWGMYPLYFLADDGESLSFDAVRSNLVSVMDSIQNKMNDGWRVVGCDINYKDNDMYCAHTNEKIPSAYGED